MNGEDIIQEKDFCSMIGSRIRELSSLARYTCRSKVGEDCFTRPLLGALLSEASETTSPTWSRSQ